MGCSHPTSKLTDILVSPATHRGKRRQGEGKGAVKGGGEKKKKAQAAFTNLI